MSNKILCACGKQHTRKQPLVITITACPKKKHHSHIGTKQSTSRKPTASDGAYSSVNAALESQTRDKGIGNENTKPSNHILICEDAGVTIPSKVAEKPLIDHSAFCDMDNEAGTSGPKKVTDEPDKDLKKMHKAEGTFFDPNKVMEDDTDSFLNSDLGPNKSKTDNKKSDESLADKSSKVKWDDGAKDHESASRLDSSKKDATNNFPSDTEMKLPIVTPRYHGPGCAMEVDVMEKHDQNCRYRKMRNPERNPIDDRSGSYEVIGRLRFKTCHPTPRLHQDFNKTNNHPNSAKVSTIYSLFTNIHQKFNNGKLCLGTSDSDKQLQTYLRRKMILEDLAKSSKSFPSHSKRFVEERRQIKFEEETEKVNNLCHNKNVTSYDVEVLYFYGNKSDDKSIQFSGMPSSKYSFKKWFYYIFPCISIEESQTLLLN